MSRKAYEELLTKIDNAFDELHDAIRYDELIKDSIKDGLLGDSGDAVSRVVDIYMSDNETDEQQTSGDTPDFNPVTDPVQYHIGGIETIDIMRIVLTREEFKGYLKGNIIKYRERAMHKGKPEEDWAKAREYKRIYTIEFGHTDMSELKDDFDNGVRSVGMSELKGGFGYTDVSMSNDELDNGVGLDYWDGIADGFKGFEWGDSLTHDKAHGVSRLKKEYRGEGVKW